MWTDYPVWFIHELQVSIWFWSSADHDLQLHVPEIFHFKF